MPFDWKDGVEFIEIGLSALLGSVVATFRSGRKVGTFETRLEVVEKDTKQLKTDQKELKKELEDLECIDPEDCRDKQAALQQLVQAQLDAGNQQFAEIKQMLRDTITEIRENQKASQAQHNLLVTELLKGGKK